MAGPKFKKGYRGGPKPGGGRSAGRYQKNKTKTYEKSSLGAGDKTSQEEKWESTRLAHKIDESMGFARYDSGPKRVGWLVNMHSV